MSPLFVAVDTVEVAHTFAVLGILSVGDVDFVVVMTAAADQLLRRLWPNRVLGVAIELPELLSAHRIVPRTSSVAATWTT